MPTSRFFPMATSVFMFSSEPSPIFTFPLGRWSFHDADQLECQAYSDYGREGDRLKFWRGRNGSVDPTT
jgi:hypothetical protein